MSSDLNLERFAPHVGSNFTVHTGEPRSARLVEAKEISSASSGRVPFTLLFEVEWPTPMQGTFKVEHDEMGEMLIFVVPVGLKDGVASMEAIFS